MMPSNIEIMKTPAEKAVSGYFADVAAGLPGGEDIRRVREAAVAQIEAKGLPHRRIEAWKYTDLRARMKDLYTPSVPASASASLQAVDAALGPLSKLEGARYVLVDGRFATELSTPLDALDGLTVKPMAQALADPCFAEINGAPIEIEQDHAVVALNTAFMTDGMAIHIAGVLAHPVHIVHVTTGVSERLISTRNVIALADGATATVVESFVALEDGASQTNALSHVGLGHGATLHHVKAQLENAATTHLSTWVADLAAETTYRAFQFSTGAALARNQIAIRFRGEYAKLDVSGTGLACGAQHCDTTLVVDHAVPHCESREFYKFILNDAARAVFQGKVIVRREAQKTDGKQMAKALMLSESCEFDSKPELEIYADDVACGHGSTSEQLDAEQVFYLRSRGIPDGEAKALLTEAFVAEAIDRIAHESLREALAAIASAWLAANASQGPDRGGVAAHQPAASEVVR